MSLSAKDAVQGKGRTVYSCQLDHVTWMKYYAEIAFLAGGCKAACAAGKTCFPDLKLVRGLVSLSNSGDIDFTGILDNDLVKLFVNGLHANTWAGFRIHLVPHWWLETEDGRIVDGSFKQFTDPKGCYRAEVVYGYYPFPERLKDKLPIGKCFNCGDLIYPWEENLHKECEAEYAAILNDYMGCLRKRNLVY